MAKENSLVQDAFIQMKNLEEAVAENAKGILASTMKAEISELVKESLFEQEDEIEDTDVDMDVEDDVEDTDLDAEMDTDNLDIDTQGEEDFDMEMDDEEPIDLTGDDVSDEEVLRVFQLMGPEDEVIVQKDNEGNIKLKDNSTNKEYMIVQESDMDNEEMFEWDDLDEDDDLDMSGLEEDDELDMSGLEEDDELDMSGLDEDDEFMGLDEDDEFMGLDEDDEFMGLDEDDMDVDSIVERLFNEQESYDGLAEDEFEGFDDVEDFDDEEEADSEIMYEIEMDDEMDEDEEEPVMESKKTIRPKGVGMGKAKFNYDSKPNQGKGFNTKLKQGPKSVGTGNAKKGFSYDKSGENLDGEFKVKPKKVEAKEASRIKGNGSNFRSGGLPKPRAHSSANTAIKENQNRQELQILREKNEEYRKALNVFRNKLNEVAVFNSNLAYATRLFTEHTTTKPEKINILRRFDSVETIKESKNLFQSLKEELSGGNSKPINESIERTIDKSPSTGSAVNLIESKTYENPQFLRMKYLMTKIK